MITLFLALSVCCLPVWADALLAVPEPAGEPIVVRRYPGAIEMRLGVSPGAKFSTLEWAGGSVVEARWLVEGEVLVALISEEPQGPKWLARASTKTGWIDREPVKISDSGLFAWAVDGDSVYFVTSSGHSPVLTKIGWGDVAGTEPPTMVRIGTWDGCQDSLALGVAVAGDHLLAACTEPRVAHGRMQNWVRIGLSRGMEAPSWAPTKVGVGRSAESSPELLAYSVGEGAFGVVTRGTFWVVDPATWDDVGDKILRHKELLGQKVQGVYPNADGSVLVALGQRGSSTAGLGGFPVVLRMDSHGVAGALEVQSRGEPSPITAALWTGESAWVLQDQHGPELTIQHLEVAAPVPFDRDQDGTDDRVDRCPSLPGPAEGGDGCGCPDLPSARELVAHNPFPLKNVPALVLPGCIGGRLLIVDETIWWFDDCGGRYKWTAGGWTRRATLPAGATHAIHSSGDQVLAAGPNGMALMMAGDRLFSTWWPHPAAQVLDVEASPWPNSLNSWLVTSQGIYRWDHATPHPYWEFRTRGVARVGNSGVLTDVLLHGGTTAKIDGVNFMPSTGEVPKGSPHYIDLNQSGNGALLVAGPRDPVAYVPYNNRGWLGPAPDPTYPDTAWSVVEPYPWSADTPLVDAGYGRMAGYHERTLGMWAGPSEWAPLSRAMFTIPEAPGVAYALLAAEEGSLLVPMRSNAILATMHLPPQGDLVRSSLVLPPLAAAREIADCPPDCFDACYERAFTADATLNGASILGELRLLDSLDRSPAEPVLALVAALRSLAAEENGLVFPIEDDGLAVVNRVGNTTLDGRPITRTKNADGQWTLSSGWQLKTLEGRIVEAEQQQ